MIKHLAFVVPLLPLSAQSAPPLFVPKVEPMAWVRCDGIPELRAKWADTRIGELFDDADIQALIAKCAAQIERGQVQRREVFAEASRLQVVVPAHVVRNLFANPNPLGDLGMPLAEMRRLEFFATMKLEGERPQVDTCMALSCLPQFEGRWTQRFEAEAASLRAAPWLVEQSAAKVSGYNAYRFTPTPALSEELDKLGIGFGEDASKDVGKWLLHVPSTFVVGSGVPDDVGSVVMSPAKQDAGLSMYVGLQEYMKPLTMAVEVPAEFGLDALHSLTWSLRFVGDQLAEQIALQLTEGVPLQGVVGALLAGGGKLLPQALPKGALMQLRFGIGYEPLLAALAELSGGELPIPEGIKGDVDKMLDGSLAFGLCAPKQGGVIPRMYLTLGVADAEAVDRVLARCVAEGMPIKNVTYGGVECSVFKFPDMPQGIQPALCRIGDKLHIAESALSLRDFLKLQDGEQLAMDVGTAPQPVGAGQLVEAFDARFDMPQLYRTFYETWLPLYELTAPSGRFVTRADMPDPDVIEEHVQPMRGSVYRDGNRYVLHHRGTIGPALMAYLIALLPMIDGPFADPQSDWLAACIAEHKLAAVWASLQQFEQREGRRPKDLAELFVAEKLTDDALLLAMDEAAEEVRLPGGKVVRSSFRYFPKGIAVPQLGLADVLLVDRKTSRFDRVCLAADGSVHRVYALDLGLDSLDK